MQTTILRCKKYLTGKFKVTGIFIACILYGSIPAFASHGIGGELTWASSQSGQVQFQLKFYRDCNGINPANFISLSTSIPSLPTIPLTLFSQNDISPAGFMANGVSSCSTCAQGNVSNPIMGLVEEFIYVSAWVNLPGVPPPGGWSFYWGECCRSNNITNLASPWQFGFRNRAIMYAYPGTSAGVCYDSSPGFVDVPVVITCIGYPVSYSAAANDNENDSLVYSWGVPLDEFGDTLNFAPGYNVNSQLPSSFQNPANVAAVINPLSGQINFTSYTAGYFATLVKVTAYKCGVKVAEVFREINVVLNNNCPTILNGSNNQPPDFTAPFPDPVTQLPTSYSDTVNAGDIVSFSMNVTDADMFLNGMSQQVTVIASGTQFGTGYTNPSSGCGQPPCATLDQPFPVSFPIAGLFSFNWVTSCDHVGGTGTCGANNKTYYFVFRAHDNYCPAGATKAVTVSITVVGRRTSIYAPDTLMCYGDTIMLIAKGADSYSWDNGMTGDTIYVTQPGTYIVNGIYPPGSCFMSDADTVTIGSNAIAVNANPNTATLCINAAPLTLSGVPSGGTWSGPGMTGNSFNPSQAGLGTHILYYVKTNSSGCAGMDSVVITVNLCTGIEEASENNGISLHPVPADDVVNLRIAGKQNQAISIRLFNIYGQTVMNVFEGSPDNNDFEIPIDISTIPAGLYLVSITGRFSAQAVLVKSR